jgi:hypothetical protein
MADVICFFTGALFGSLFTAFMICAHSKNDPKLLGYDWGASNGDHSCKIFGYKDEHGVIHITDVVYREDQQ